jgi:hypothetical protein
MKNKDAILHVHAVLINTSKTVSDINVYKEFEAAGHKVIEQLKAQDKLMKGYENNGCTQN